MFGILVWIVFVFVLIVGFDACGVLDLVGVILISVLAYFLLVLMFVGLMCSLPLVWVLDLLFFGMIAACVCDL